MVNLQNNRFVIKFNNAIAGNFIRIPSSVADAVYSSHVEIQRFRFKLNGKWYFSWDGFDSAYDRCIEINPVLGKTLGFTPDQLIIFEMEQFDVSKSLLSEVCVKPLSSDDWEIAELHSSYLQEEILNQTKIVNLGGVLVCYVGNTICRLRVEKLIPEKLQVGLIGDGSLIIIEPMENKLRNQKLNMKSEEITVSTKRLLCWNVDNDSQWNQMIDSGMTLYMNEDEVVSEFGYVSIIENKIEKGTLRVDSHKETKQNKAILKCTKRVAVRISAVEVGQTNPIPVSHVILGSTVWGSLGINDGQLLNNGTRLSVEFVTNHETATKTSQPDSRIIFNFIDGVDERDNIQSKIDGILNLHYLTNMQLFRKERVVVELLNGKGTHLKHINLTQMEKKNIIIEKRYNCEVSSKIEPFQKNDNMEKNNVFVKLDDTIDQIVAHLRKRVVGSPGIVIDGSLGVGKTTLLLEISHILRSTSECHITFFDCEALNDMFSFEKMRTFICNQLVSLSYWYQPSVIIIDNAEFLFNRENRNGNGGGGANGGSNGNSLSDKLTLLLIHEITQITSKWNGSIKVIFASRRKDLLNHYLFEKHFVSKTWSLKSPTKGARKMLLDALLPQRGISISPDITTNDMSMAIEGYSILDIKNLVERLLYGVMLDSDQSVLNANQFQEINESFVPVFLQGVEKSSSSKQQTQGAEQSWAKIGGLVEAKRILLETLEWPVKYAPIFSRSPLRLRSGLLIYGYPGCGKTLLASAVARECGGLNFLPVKGPEILNKYIGASEQNVRELFEKAQSLRPCVLFFDEFDSVATKRGHDSTGVTDRVVNQLLTQMDGAEQLEGVYVVAATSRPDLIDPALLRPGRLDKSVFCDIPDSDSRIDILKRLLGETISNKISGEDLKQIVEFTEGYSGADLQGLYYNAHLRVVHRQLSSLNATTDNAKKPNETEYTILSPTNSNFEEIDGKIIQDIILQSSQNKIKDFNREDNNNNNNIVSSNSMNTTSHIEITAEDLLICCKETRASISPHERAKLSVIYNEFQGNSRPAELHDGDIDRNPGTRLTLA
ncbi:similar to Saccharomyces cerevisiae YKL197C PEX1 AAA-peroxin [Maudiozyma saulgeensis]|uniref:Peroxisomal ATPase PEX1 n=1 Tax=Maudiozyma saulgeensis TaxID=1789683 RepID=A0A1X7R1B2_9SACH|nr:similar to Saccharomyces cerevisiae YKL197C PEX1 AAA-peroxin [Kazachstania saulgeensis]